MTRVPDREVPLGTLIIWKPTDDEEFFKFEVPLEVKSNSVGHLSNDPEIGKQPFENEFFISFLLKFLLSFFLKEKLLSDFFFWPLLKLF